MNISFKSIQTVSSDFDYKKMENSEKKFIPVSLSLKLDNEDGNDLDEFLRILPKDSLSKQELTQLKKNGILNIVTAATYDKDSNSEANVYINDCEVNDLDVLFKLTELTDKVIEKNNNPINNENVKPEYNKLCANLMKSQILLVISDFVKTVNDFIDMVKGD